MTQESEAFLKAEPGSISPKESFILHFRNYQFTYDTRD